MQSLLGVNLSSAQPNVPPKIKDSGDQKFAPALKQATKEAKEDDLAGAATVSAQRETESQVEKPRGEDKGVGSKSEQRTSADGDAVEGGKAETKTAEIKTGKDVGETKVSVAVEGKKIAGDAAETLVPVQPSDTPVMDGTRGDGGVAAADAVRVKMKNIATQRGLKGVTAQEPVVENLSKGAAVAAEVQNRLKGQEIKTEIVDAAINSSVTQQGKSLVSPEGALVDVTAVQQGEGTLVEKGKSGSAKSNIITDPLFADLLNKPGVATRLREQHVVSGHTLHHGSAGENTTLADSGVVLSDGAKQAGIVEGGTVLVDTSGGVTLAGDEPLDLPVMQAKSAVADTMVAHHHGGAHATLTANSNSATETMMPLKDGSMLPESRVVQQTIDHLSVHVRGESSSVTVKLHPEELGELQLRMVMEGDKLRVHLHTQSQQVQEVLERHFPRLRDALQDAGVSVDDFQVSSDASGQHNQQAFAQQDFNQSSGSATFGQYDDETSETLASVVAATAPVPNDSLSVRV